MMPPATRYVVRIKNFANQYLGGNRYRYKVVTFDKVRVFNDIVGAKNAMRYAPKKLEHTLYSETFEYEIRAVQVRLTYQ